MLLYLKFYLLKTNDQAVEFKIFPQPDLLIKF